MNAKRLALFVVVLFVLLSVAPASAQQTRVVTLFHFSDYHSHAVPFYAQGQQDTAGIARAIAYLKPFAKDGTSLIFSGGDTMNLGAPAWSDKFHCAEWPLFNGILSAMAFGNHDADYGPQVFAQCQKSISYPILSSNTLDGGGRPLFQHKGKTYMVFKTNGMKIGVFALAGADFTSLVKPATMPAPGVTFSDRIAAARQVVDALRNQEHVNAVVLIGHSLREDDIALAKAVPGIDIIFGSHSHRQENLFRIPDTQTYMLSPFQYLTYISKLHLFFTDGVLTKVEGGLVRMSNNLPQDPKIAQMVARMQSELQADPQYAPLFKPIGTADVELSTDGQFTGEAVLGNFVMDIFRTAAGSHMALSTASSFREPIAPGTILEEGLRTALPYKNRILVFDLPGAQVQKLLDFSVSRSGSDFFSQVSGVRFAIIDGKATNIQLLKDPANPAAGYAALNPAATYKVATTDFQGLIAGGYKALFADAPYNDTKIDVRDLVRSTIQAHASVTGSLDGRIASGASAP